MSVAECATTAGVLSAVVVDTPETAPWLLIGQKLSLLFKETEVWPLPEGGLANFPHRLAGTVVRAQAGEVLCRLDVATAAGPVVALVDAAWFAALSPSSGMALGLGVHPAAVALQLEGEG